MDAVPSGTPGTARRLNWSIRQLEIFESEVRGAAEYYVLEAPEMLEAFLAELDATIRRIERFPTAPRVVRGATRAMHMQARFPYSVLYFVHKHLELIDVTIFLHDRQDQHCLLPRFR